ncbi:MAG TPA: hypothetical protein VF447_11650 [Terriglobales bacterium]
MTSVCYKEKKSKVRFFSVSTLILCIVALAAVPRVNAQETRDLDDYTVRFDGFWFYSQPRGSFHGTPQQGFIDFQKDVNFNSYNTGAFRAEWRFTRKNHIFFGAIPLNQTKDITVTRPITFQGQTYLTGLAATARLQTYIFTPGYQYDILRRRQGHLSIVAQLDLCYIRGSVRAAAQTVNGSFHTAEASSATLRAPLPVAGPEFRYYLIPNSRRLFVDGNVLGMYFFGYGNFISSYGTVGVAINKNINFQGGYQLGSRINIKSDTNRIGLNLTQTGAIAGLEVSF